jgi:hypothetical protein
MIAAVDKMYIVDRIQYVLCSAGPTLTFELFLDFRNPIFSLNCCKKPIPVAVYMNNNIPETIY